jgi:signal transduction histidine kinase
MTKVDTNLLLRDFSQSAREALLREASTREYAPGEMIFNEGDPSEGLCLILEGSVEVFKLAGSHEEVLAIYRPSDYFGEVSVLDGGDRSTSARARAPGVVTLVVIPRDKFLDVLVQEPVPVTLNLFRRVLQELRRADSLFIGQVLQKEKLSLVGEMAGSLMHDLRNPLTGIGLASETINLRHQDPETAQTCERIRLQCDRVAAMAQELLDFSRDETRLQLRETTTTEFLEQFCILHQDLFDRTDVVIEAGAEFADIRIDPMRLWRLLQNLLNNALEAVTGRPDARIDIATWAKAGVLHLTVSDNGPGLPERVKARLFEPFVTEGKLRGTGLGLSIARNIVDAHGGTIDVKTSADQGTTWLIALPQHSKTQQLPMPRPL